MVTFNFSRFCWVMSVLNSTYFQYSAHKKCTNFLKFYNFEAAITQKSLEKQDNRNDVS